MLTILVAAIPVTGFSSEPTSLRCKYSVRDVGFVNVHSFGWQLTLAKPEEFSTSEFEELDAKIAAALRRTNVHHLWVASDSKEMSRLRSHVSAPNSQKDSISGVLSSSRGDHFPLYQVSEGEKLDPEDLVLQAKQLGHSTIRQQILDSCCDSLCSLILLESDSAKHNTAAKVLLKSATEKLEQQMWMLEKPTNKAPQSLVLTLEDQSADPWFCRTIGLKSGSEPTFAIAYGQGRILGNLIPLEQASVDKLVGTASICGGDCECDLDKDWLYGQQFVHQWSTDLERRAERTLNFDPHAAYVKSEVASIIRKTRKGNHAKRIDLGPGLIIHDLDDLESKSGARKSVSSAPKNQDGSVIGSPTQSIPKEATESNVAAQGSSSNTTPPVDPQINRTQGTTHESERDDPDHSTGFVIRTPVVILMLLALTLGGAILWSLMRAG